MFAVGHAEEQLERLLPVDLPSSDFRTRVSAGMTWGSVRLKILILGFSLPSAREKEGRPSILFPVRFSDLLRGWSVPVSACWCVICSLIGQFVTPVTCSNQRGTRMLVCLSVCRYVWTNEKPSVTYRVLLFWDILTILWMYLIHNKMKYYSINLKYDKNSCITFLDF